MLFGAANIFDGAANIFDGAANIFDICLLHSKMATKMRAFLLAILLVEPQIRLELMTCRLQGGCSTN